ncbi:MAG: sigma-54 dependent transcriptional regulator [Geobacteraceae bacterium]|nr:sigma-54 dependent transcriptional regulator [Geobacteraceae bacterium]
MPIKKILIADDEESIRWILSSDLSRRGFEVDMAEDGPGARELASTRHYDLALFDVNMPGSNGLELLTEFHLRHPHTLVVIMTAEASMENAMEAMKRGAYDYLTKPFDPGAIDAVILKAQKTANLSRQVEQLRSQIEDEDVSKRIPRCILGTSAAMQELYKTLGRVVASNVTVLVTGESGTGKELVARAIHMNSPRSTNPFVALNCAAIPHDLLESELFGHERGAFTGAVERRSGKFEQAQDGTLFLDEIGDMSLDLQAKLLRVLQEKELTRTGGNRAMSLDVRIVAATHRDLGKLVEEQQFREDLFYRLNVINVDVPPLREREGDIALLAEFFLKRAQEDFGLENKVCSPEALEVLTQHTWPGNVRELENTIKRAALLSSDSVLTPGDFKGLGAAPEVERNSTSLEHVVREKLEASLARLELEELDDLYSTVIRQVEKPLLEIALQRVRGNQVKAAKILGINRNTLRKKMTSLGID